MIVIARTVAVRPERRDDVVRAARTMMAATRRDSEEALVRHFGTQHMAAFRAQLPGLLAGPPRLTRHIVSGADPM
jgi:quinol monooxygenase YgiN